MRALAHATAAALVALALAAALALLGNALTRAGVAHQGEQAWADWRAARSPWRWTLRQPRDVVAGRAFGPGRISAAGTDALTVAFAGGALQLGLRLARPASLRQAPLLALQLTRSQALPLSIIVRRTLTAPACVAAAGRLPATAVTLRIDLAALHWRCADAPAMMPARAAMLRLQIAGPAGARIALRGAALLSTAPVALTTPLPWSAWRAAAPAMDTVPVVWLPARFSSHLLAQRDALWRRDPAAVALPAGVLPHAPAAPATMPWGWIVIALCALPMLLAWPGPGPRHLAQRPAWLLQALAAMLPVLLVAYGIGDSQTPDLRSGTLITLALGYALLLTLREDAALRPWHWLGSWRTTWLPLLPAVLASVLWLLQAQHAPQPADFARYLPWAALQQFLVLVVVARRLDAALGRRTAAVLAAATLFALGHAPNTALMLLAFAAGLWWAWWFLRRGALLPVVLAHALAGTLLQATASDSGWLRSLAIGARYLGSGG